MRIRIEASIGIFNDSILVINWSVKAHLRTSLSIIKKLKSLTMRQESTGYSKWTLENMRFLEFYK